MARTKASVGAKISSGKSSKARCSVTPAVSIGTSSGSSDKSSRGSGGGNPVCPRETPKWQKPITTFFIHKPDDSRESDGDGEAAGSSKSKSKKRNIIHSDDDTTPQKPKNNKEEIHEKSNEEKPKNNELDETLELEPLTGEDSHKLQEYYPKGKGVGKKTNGTKHVSISKEEEEGVKLQDLNENSNSSSGGDSTDKDNSLKGKGIGKKTKETKHVECNGVSEKRDRLEEGEKVTETKSIDKENIDSNIDIESDKESSVVGRKREREDRIEDSGNISKKVKVN